MVGQRVQGVLHPLRGDRAGSVPDVFDDLVSRDVRMGLHHMQDGDPGLGDPKAGGAKPLTPGLRPGP